MPPTEPPPTGPSGAPAALPAGFGLATTTFVIVASMVGAGVLTTSGLTVAAVGSHQLMLLLWVVGGVWALCGALSLAELCAAIPRTGGDYAILYEAYGPLAAFLSGWVTLLLGFAAPIAASATGSASYLVAPLGLEGPADWLARRVVATAVVVAFAAIHASGQSRTVRAQGAITLVELALLGLFVAAGLARGRSHWANLDDRPPVDVGVATSMGFALVYVAYAYLGWNAASYLAGEVADPRRRLPRAFVLGTGGVTGLYLAINVVYALALPADEIRRIAAGPGGPEAITPIAELAARRLFGDRLATPCSWAFGLMMLSSLSAFVLAGPRIAFAMARAGQFPAVAGRLSPRSQTPSVATAILVALALGLLWSGTFAGIIVYSSVGMSAFTMLTIASVYVLRVRRPDLPRPFRTPGYPVVPAVYLVVSALLTLAALTESAESRRITFLSLLSIAAGVPVYYLWTYFQRPSRVSLPEDD